MRTYGRIFHDDGSTTWVEVQTNSKTGNDYVFITALAQTLKLNLNESPFYGDSGIPAKPSVVQQIFPDFYVTITQQRYAPHFASLIVTKLPSSTPDYLLNVVTNQGVRVTGDEVPT